MNAEATVVAGTQDQGVEALRKAFNDFYGHENWTFTREPEADADYVTVLGEVLSWRITGKAEG